ncbi:cupredoxin domain-containing protein [Paenibacillus solisilvae]|uniref:Cupredoxin domain-containing protein n=1 Tax=Paenibacillus solisilvae TaxID=2486751 RepID=A0ABW0VU00_9BACL
MKKGLLLVFLLAATVLVLAACGSKNNDAAPASANNSGVEEPGTAASTELVIEASRFKFDQPVYKIKKGEATKITLDSSDGIHGISIPDLNVKLDAGKSEVVTINDAGEYEFQCNVMCGTGHSKMVAKIVVE